MRRASELKDYNNKLYANSLPFGLTNQGIHTNNWKAETKLRIGINWILLASLPFSGTARKAEQKYRK